LRGHRGERVQEINARMARKFRRRSKGSWCPPGRDEEFRSESRGVRRKKKSEIRKICDSEGRKPLARKPDQDSREKSQELLAGKFAVHVEVKRSYLSQRAGRFDQLAKEKTQDGGEKRKKLERKDSRREHTVGKKASSLHDGTTARAERGVF